MYGFLGLPYIYTLIANWSHDRQLIYPVEILSYSIVFLLTLSSVWLVVCLLDLVCIRGRYMMSRFDLEYDYVRVVRRFGVYGLISVLSVLWFVFDTDMGLTTHLLSWCRSDSQKIFALIFLTHLFYLAFCVAVPGFCVFILDAARLVVRSNRD